MVDCINCGIWKKDPIAIADEPVSSMEQILFPASLHICTIGERVGGSEVSQWKEQWWIKSESASTGHFSGVGDETND